MQQERHYNSNHYDDSKVLVNASDNRKPQGRGRGYSSGSSSSGSGNRSNSFGAKNKECSFCGKTNHIVENCYRKHEFPPHYGKSNASTNNASQEEREDVGDNQGARISDFGLTKEQCSQLLNLLQTTQSGNQGSSYNAGNQASSSTQVNIASGHVTSGNLVCTLHSSPGQWIIDSGASDHIFSSFDYFSSYKSIKPISVKLPNGQVSIANYSGSVKFSSIFTISHVLLVPDFNLNLISVPKLCLDNHFLVSFDNDKCLIQEKKNLKMIGLGKLNGGLYYFNQNQVQPKSTTIASSQVTHSHVIPKEALWHFRLGHLSNSKLLDMHKQFPFVKVDDHAVCDICHYAKHRKPKFSLSSNKTKHCYELFHFDIWGPFSVPSIHGHKYFVTALDDHSRFTWIILCKAKSEVSTLVQQFLLMIENQYNCHVKTVRTDNGLKFFMPNFYASK
ncbi:peptide transporter PTR2, partial [Trifolium pratense]